MPADPYPRDLAFEFDRENVRRYLRTKWSLSWVLFIGGLGAFLSTVTIEGILKRAGGLTPESALTCLRAFALGAGAGMAVGALCYLVFSHFQASVYADAVSLRIEGAFLRLREGRLFKSDRKLHFRSIIDYAVVEGPLLRRFGLKTLTMTIPVGTPRGLIAVTGLRDCEKVRDQLAEIDALRELA